MPCAGSPVCVVLSGADPRRESGGGLVGEKSVLVRGGGQRGDPVNGAVRSRRRQAVRGEQGPHHKRPSVPHSSLCTSPRR